MRVRQPDNRDKLELFVLPSEIRMLGGPVSKGKYFVKCRGCLEYMSQAEHEMSPETVLAWSMLVDVTV